LGDISYRPGAGGKQNVGQAQRAIGKNDFFIIDEQSIIILLIFFATVTQCQIDNAMQLIMITK
jgi:hypothetical protein